MNQHDEIQAATWLRDGIAAAKAGRRDEARELLGKRRVDRILRLFERYDLNGTGRVGSDEMLACIQAQVSLP
ncbi:MAG: hypothetical protein GY824_32095, partial [Delftia sp.]|nr:hypothetical protein [Delftia sp.]